MVISKAKHGFGKRVNNDVGEEARDLNNNL